MTGRIFINYRREDSQHPAGRLYDQLEPEFGKQQIFIDVDHIAAGADFVEVLHSEVSKCDVMLSIIGKKWLGVVDQATGARRLDNPDDFVRIEIEAALARGIVIIPVLVDGAQMPGAGELSDSLKALSRRNGVRLTHERFRDDSAGLIRGIEQALATIEGQRNAVQQQQLQAEQAEARRHLAEQQAQERQMDDNAFQQARATNNTEAYRAYLAAYPEGPNAGEAKAILKRLKPFPLGAVLGGASILALLAGGVVTYINMPNYVPLVLERPSEMKGSSQAQRPIVRQVWAPGTIFDDCNGAGWCPSMVVVPKGSFMMGSKSGDSDERPVHRVTFDRPFAVGRFELTFKEWDVCVKGGGCKYKPEDEGWGKGKRPVINVSWNDAKTYLKWLSKKTGKPYRLLSEAEWEYVARGNEGSRKYWWGNEASHEYANYGRDECCGGLKKGADKWKYTSPVGSFSKNPFKVHDMHGNVWEWVEDCYKGSYKGAPTNGRANATGGCDYRVLRGGSWINFPLVLRSAIRDRFNPVNRNYDYGFRVARSVSLARTR